MAEVNTGYKRPTEIKIMKTVGSAAPVEVANFTLLAGFTYNSVPYPVLTSSALAGLSLADYTARFNALQALINASYQTDYPGLNLAFVEADFSVRDSNLCPI